MKLEYKDKNKENWFLISWTLSNKCNYKCSYCPEDLHNGTTGQPLWSTVERFIKNFHLPGKEICYRISGGEPTYWKHFVDMAKLVKEQGHYFSFLTNGSQSVNYYRQISNHSDGIMISYHPEYADTNHIIDICNNVNCLVVLNLMLSNDNFDQMIEIADKIFSSSNNVAIWPKIILEKTNVDFITNRPQIFCDRKNKFLKEWPYFKILNDIHLHRGDLLLDQNSVDINELIVNGKNNFFGWKCWAGQHMINIDKWGNIYRADCQQGGPLGNLERFQLPKDILICQKNVCACLSDIYLRKETI